MSKPAYQIQSRDVLTARRYIHKKLLVEQAWEVPIEAARGFKRVSHDAIKNIHWAILAYQYQYGNEEKQYQCYRVQLTWIPCNFGSERPWFLCPAAGCGRRIAILYGGKIFACRHCYQLTYASQRETSGDRAARRADKIRERLGWEPGILNGPGWKPKGMHWRTFERLFTQHEQAVQESFAAMSVQLQSVEKLLNRNRKSVS